MTSIFTAYSDRWRQYFPAHWTLCRIKDFIESSRAGVWGDESKSDLNDIVCYRMADFDYPNYCLNFDNLTLRNILPNQQEGRLLQYGDLLLEKSGGGEKMPVGRVVFVNSNQRAVCSNFIQALSVSDKASPRFVLYLFNSIYTNRVNTLFFNQTTGIQNLQTPYYLSQEIAMPPIDEQEAIAAYLDRECEKIGQQIELLERKADAYKRLRRSIINRAVTRGLNPKTPLKPSDNEWIGDIPAHWDYERLEKHFHSNTLVNKNFEYTRAFKFYMGTIVPKEENLEEEEYREVYEKYTIVEQNDIMINGLNLNYDLKSMRVGIVPYKGIITSAYVVLRPFEGVNAQFFNYLFKAFDYRKFFHGMGKGVRLTLSFNELRTFEIPVPPKDEQMQIVAYLDEKCGKIDAIIEKIGTKVERLKELKRSLINEVVTGKRAITTCKL